MSRVVERIVWVCALCVLGLFHSWQLSSLREQPECKTLKSVRTFTQLQSSLSLEEQKELWTRPPSAIEHVQPPSPPSASPKTQRTTALSSTVPSCPVCTCNASSLSAAGFGRPCSKSQMKLLHAQRDFTSVPSLFDQVPQIKLSVISRVAGGGLRNGSELLFYKASIGGGQCDAYVYEVKDGFRIETMIVNSAKIFNSENALVAYAYEKQLRHILVVFSGDEYEAVLRHVRTASAKARMIAAENANVINTIPHPNFLDPLPPVNVALPDKWASMMTQLQSSFNAECIATLLWNDATDNQHQLDLYPGCREQAIGSAKFNLPLIDIEEIDRQWLGFAKLKRRTIGKDTVRVYQGRLSTLDEFSVFIVRVQINHSCPGADAVAAVARTPSSLFCVYPDDNIRDDGSDVIPSSLSEHLVFVNSEISQNSRISTKLLDSQKELTSSFQLKLLANVTPTDNVDIEAYKSKQDELVVQFNDAGKTLFDNATLLDWDDIDVPFGRNNILASGGFGTVFNVSYWGRPAALKVSDNIMAIHETLMMTLVMGEPNIVQLFGVACVRHHPSHFAILMELVPGTNMYLGLKSLKAAQVALSVSRAARALSHLHKMNIVHLDVKGGNFIIGLNMTTMIDLGISLPVGTYSKIGTSIYMAPERTSPVQIPTHPMMDVYSLGVTLLKANSSMADNCFSQRRLHVEISPLCTLAAWCIAGDWRLRPSAHQLALLLYNLATFWEKYPPNQGGSDSNDSNNKEHNNQKGSAQALWHLPPALKNQIPIPVESMDDLQRFRITPKQALLQLMAQLAVVHKRGYLITGGKNDAMVVMMLPSLNSTTLFIIAQPFSAPPITTLNILNKEMTKETILVCQWFKRVIGEKNKVMWANSVLTECEKERTASELYALLSAVHSDEDLDLTTYDSALPVITTNERLKLLQNLTKHEQKSFWWLSQHANADAIKAL